MNLSRKIRYDLIRVLISEADLFGDSYDELTAINFIDDILDLKTLSSEDSRFNDAYEDSIQHMVNNDDWDYMYVLTERFDIVKNEEIFLKFLNKLIHPNTRRTEDNITRYLLLINPYLEKEKLQFALTDYNDDNLPVYEVRAIDSSSSTSANIPINKIPFYVIDTPSGFNDNSNSYRHPKEFPSFVLVNNNHWNDYGNYSSYYLHYHPSQDDIIKIGNVKIIHQTENNTREILKGNFLTLDDSFCSLGQEYDYYQKVKNTFPKNFVSILLALRDTAFFPGVLDDFESHYYFRNSLIRFDKAEQLLREAKYRLYDYNLKNLYSFIYTYKPKFADEEINIQFNFDSNKLIPSRIYALIGENGTGKTQLVSSLPIDIYKNNDKAFTPKTPLFSKVIAVSYSAFDSFDIPNKTPDFNYVYCGLKDSKGELLNEKRLRLRFHRSWKKISENGRFEQWMQLLPFFLDQDTIDEFITASDESLNSYEVDLKGFNSVNKKLSSGQSILLYIITEIVANIRYASLIIYDEPENHLHPNAISKLIQAIYNLTNEFKSYCIMATHSPLIVRELLSENVYILNRKGSTLSVRKPINETFGENLTVINDDIFGNYTINNQYKKILNDLANTGKSFDEIMTLISSDVTSPSLSSRIYLKNILNEKS